MCRMCEKYGENGDIWYFNEKLYARRLYEKKIGVAPTSYGDHVVMDEGEGHAETSKLLLRAIKASWDGTDEEEYKKKAATSNAAWARYGSVVLPLADAKKVLEISWPFGFMTCACAKWNLGRDERNIDEYSCMGLGPGMYKWERWPERYKGGVHLPSIEEGKAWLDKWDKKGMVHMVMQYAEGFMGGICNCDYPVCGAITWAVDYDMPDTLLKGHYVARVNWDKCNGCGKCLGRCHFGCVTKDVRRNKATISMEHCVGCGLCHTACPQGAIDLPRRETFPMLKDNWTLAPRKTGGSRKAPKITIDETKCTNPWECKQCIRNCPSSVYYFAEPRPGAPYREAFPSEYKGRLWPLYSDRCTGCNDCVERCPQKAISIIY